MRIRFSAFKGIAFSFLLFLAACKKQDMQPAEPPPAPADTVASIRMRQIPVLEPVGNAVLGYYVGLPSNYEQTTTRYPLLLFITGAGQFGNGANDLPLLLNDGPAQLIDEGKFPVSIKVGNQRLSFIVMTPQFRWWPSTYSIDACIEHAKQKYRIDSSRIYLSGLSMGGILSCDLGSEVPNKLAAIVPMAGVSKDTDINPKCRQIANAGLPVWAFHSANDPVFEIGKVRNFISAINSFSPRVPARLTEWPSGGHDSWTRALEPAYRENGKNIYEWMLQYKR
jgi:predicted peptidase